MRLRWGNRVNAQATPAALAGAAVTFNDVADQLRLSAVDQQALVERCALAATSTVEQRLNRLLVRRAVTVRASALPHGACHATLYGGVVSAVTSFTVAGVTVPGSAYGVVGHSPAALVPVADWPVTSADGLPVQIVYEAGFAAGEVPPDIAAAVIMIAADLFDNPAQHVIGATVAVNPAVEALLAPWRIMPS